jgi:hypothetical protein
MGCLPRGIVHGNESVTGTDATGAGGYGDKRGAGSDSILRPPRYATTPSVT